ncbi:hypothetical protein RFI_25428 [Reticulomyxa filosa]|uniref:Developmentally-regulated GTP-binding protein 2 n=1 Tax=Reticulomyxa filosa TaxID=46433 RepID=X6MEW8_RETFI|nr:hypothetical protein RFI_25428 [Reticulomyxa filosa]|eukprot:ETO11947.1 hypothetical protein RFI_25428 [Reticulomyxa filosa]
MPGILEKIKEVEAEMARTQKNKATEHHLGLLKAKLSKFRTELMEPAKTVKGEGFDVMKSGDARCALIGFPSVGKSSFLNKVCTGTHSAEASYEFTTLTCIPGLLQYKDARIQILDLPGIIEGASKGKGKGRQVIGVARSADLVIMMLDGVRGEIQKKLLTKELEDCAIRLNQKQPDIYFKRQKSGGVKLTMTCRLTQLDEKLVRSILQQFKIHHCEIIIREDCSADQFIDVIEANRVYLPCLYVYNKIDNLTIEELDEICRGQDHNVVCSVKLNLNIDFVLERLWNKLNMIRIYAKKKGSAPDLNEPVILRNGATIEHFCHSIHREMVAKFRYALVWGRSAKHRPQHVGLQHVLEDEDVVQHFFNHNKFLSYLIFKKKKLHSCASCNDQFLKNYTYKISFN